MLSFPRSPSGCSLIIPSPFKQEVEKIRVSGSYSRRGCESNISQPASQPAKSHSVSQPASQSVKEAVRYESQSVRDQPTSQSVNRRYPSLGQPASKSAGPSVSQPVHQSVSQAVGQLVGRSVSRSVSQSNTCNSEQISKL